MDLELSPVGHSALSPGSPERIGQRAETRRDELGRGGRHALLGAIDARADGCGQARHRLPQRPPADALSRHLFRAQGPCAGAGVVEAGRKAAIGDRLKRSGMHWGVAEANDVIGCALSDRLEDFWAGRCAAATPQLAGRCATALPLAAATALPDTAETAGARGKRPYSSLPTQQGPGPGETQASRGFRAVGHRNTADPKTVPCTRAESPTQRQPGGGAGGRVRTADLRVMSPSL